MQFILRGVCRDGPHPRRASAARLGVLEMTLIVKCLVMALIAGLYFGWSRLAVSARLDTAGLILGTAIFIAGAVIIWAIPA